MQGSKLKKKESRTALLFVSPFIIGFLLFNLYPIAMSLYYSFTDFSVLSSPHWIGISNYKKLFGDALFWKSIKNTLYITVIGVPLTTVVALLTAMLLNRKTKGVGIFRTLIYIPAVVPPVAATLLWTWMLNPKYGSINSMLKLIGIKGPGWLADYRWAKPAILLMLVWAIGETMILYLASLQDVPRELYEACELDGANKFQVFIHITIPFIKPVIFYNVVTGIICMSQFFTQAYVVGSKGGSNAGLGAPNNSTLFYCLYLFKNGFGFLKMGYASAMAWLLLIFALIVTWLLLKYTGFFSDDKTGAR